MSTTPGSTVITVGKAGPGHARATHFARLGGHDAVVRLVDAFYEQMDTLPEAGGIRAMHPADLTTVKATLVKFLCEWTGGPTNYSEDHGPPQLRRRHLPFSIGEAERDAWLACMAAALAQISPDPLLTQSLTRGFSRTADFLRNRS